MSNDLARLSAAKYVILTTFRKNGNPVPTPVWIMEDNGELLVWTEKQAGKIKRIRHTSRVELQVTDMRGQKKEGPVVSGQARLDEGEGLERTRRALGRKYGLLGKIFMFFSRIRRGTEGNIAIAITLDGEPPAAPEAT